MRREPQVVMAGKGQVKPRVQNREDPTSLFQLDVAHTNPHKMSSGSSIFYVARRIKDRQVLMINVLPTTEKHPIYDFISVFRDNSHPNVISFIEHYEEPMSRKWFVLDYMRGDWLNNVISRNTLEEEHTARVTADVCAGLTYLHGLGIILRAVKADGMYLTRSGIVKLCDFEHIIRLDAPLRKGTSYKLVSPHWMPPEVARSNEYGLKTDSWGVGILVIEMLDKVPPYFHEVTTTALSRIKSNPTPALTDPPRVCGTVLQDFLMKSLCVDPRSRPQVVDLSKHEFLREPCSPTSLIPFLRHKFRPVSLENNGPKDLTGKVIRRSVFADVHGGFSDVWLGSYDISDVPGSKKSVLPVAIKVLRSVTPEPEMHRKIQKRLNRELTVWSSLRHPNIVALYGTCSDMGPYTAMVSPWFSKGSAPQFLKSLGEDATLFVRLRLLSEVAAGLDYLHRFTPTVVHGDIKGANILISGEHEACLCDFGLSTIVGEVAGSSNFTSTFAGSLRWTAPELIRPSEESGETPQVSTWSDIYALGSVSYEILSGLVPYHTRRTDVQVMFDVLQHQLPKRPSVAESAVPISDEHWYFIQSCWRENPIERPPISVASPALEAMYCAVLPPSSPSGERIRELKMASAITLRHGR